MARMRDQLELSGKTRFLLFGISIVLILVGTLFGEISVLATILFVLAGAVVGLVASSGLMRDQRRRFTRRGSVPENRCFDDVPMNPWDAITSDREDHGQECRTAGEGSSCLEQLEAQRKAGLLSKEEYEQKRQKILKEIP